jgi:quercetin dioxygenase-like cupin family protein
VTTQDAVNVLRSKFDRTCSAFGTLACGAAARVRIDRRSWRGNGGRVHILRLKETALKQRLITRSACVMVMALTAVPLSAWAVHGGDDMKWGDAPPVLTKGAKLAVLQGDPGKPGPYVMRLSMPAGYRIAPHSHTQTENVTVISGTLMVGMGDKFDAKALNTFKAGGFGSIPGKANHYAMTKGATVIQIHGEGPFDLVYVNPDDDPQKNMAAKQ